MSAPSPLVLRLLASLGRPAEAERYLTLFRAERPESFALISVGGDVSGVAGEALAVDLGFLAQLGLRPVVALESGERAAWVAAQLGEPVRAEVVPPERAAETARRRVVPLVELAAGDLARLAAELGTHKLVLLGPARGLGAPGADTIPFVDLPDELDDLAAALPAEQAAQLRRAAALVDAVPHAMTVAITSPFELLRELFTVRGAGTLVRRCEPVAVHRSLDEIDRSRAGALIEAAFDRRLRPEFWSRPIERVYLAGAYRGAAVVSPTASGPYLSKLAVDLPARGEGVGRDLWRALTRDYPSLYWRARPDNPIASWYQAQCDGMVKQRPWHIYWRGLSPDRIPAAIQAAAGAPVDLERPE